MEQNQSLEQILQRLRERSDDFDSVDIQIPEAMSVTAPNGESIPMPGVAALIQRCDGNPTALRLDVAEALLNDGILQKLNIPIRLKLLRQCH